MLILILVYKVRGYLEQQMYFIFNLNKWLCVNLYFPLHATLGFGFFFSFYLLISAENINNTCVYAMAIFRKMFATDHSYECERKR